jgi:hypothetical protein
MVMTTTTITPQVWSGAQMTLELRAYQVAETSIARFGDVDAGQMVSPSVRVVDPKTTTITAGRSAASSVSVSSVMLTVASLGVILAAASGVAAVDVALWVAVAIVFCRDTALPAH